MKGKGYQELYEKKTINKKWLKQWFKEHNIAKQWFNTPCIHFKVYSTEYFQAMLRDEIYGISWFHGIDSGL